MWCFDNEGFILVVLGVGFFFVDNLDLDFVVDLMDFDCVFVCVEEYIDVSVDVGSNWMWFFEGEFVDFDVFLVVGRIEVIVFVMDCILCVDLSVGM